MVVPGNTCLYLSKCLVTGLVIYLHMQFPQPALSNSEILKYLELQYWDIWTWDYKSCSFSAYWMKRQKCADNCPTISQRQDCDSGTSLLSDLSKSLSKMDFWQHIQHLIGSYQIWASGIVTGTPQGQSWILWAFCISILIPTLHEVGILPNCAPTQHPDSLGRPSIAFYSQLDQTLWGTKRAQFMNCVFYPNHWKCIPSLPLAGKQVFCC